MLVLALHALINIYSSHLVAMFNNISVWWHVAGVAVILGILIVGPTAPELRRSSSPRRSTTRASASGMFWFYVLPLGFLLTQYTITGFDASAHISEETHGAAEAAPKGVWRSVFYSALIGWVLLLALTFAATDTNAINDGGGGSLAILDSALSARRPSSWSSSPRIGQLFCGMACVTSASRMTYAFSRDRAIPGWQIWTRLNHNRTPVGAVLFVVRRRAAHHAAGAVERRGGHPGRLLRGRVRLRDRPVHRLRDPDLPALADGRRVQARPVDQRRQVPAG